MESDGGDVKIHDSGGGSLWLRAWMPLPHPVVGDIPSETIQEMGRWKEVGMVASCTNAPRSSLPAAATALQHFLMFLPCWTGDTFHQCPRESQWEP